MVNFRGARFINFSEFWKVMGGVQATLIFRVRIFSTIFRVGGQKNSLSCSFHEKLRVILVVGVSWGQNWVLTWNFSVAAFFGK